MTSDDVVKRLFIRRSGMDSPRVASGFLLCSDGVERALVNRRTGELASAIGTMFEWLDRSSQEVVEASLRSNLLSVFRMKCADDSTIVLMTTCAEETSIEHDESTCA